MILDPDDQYHFLCWEGCIWSDSKWRVQNGNFKIACHRLVNKSTSHTANLCFSRKMNSTPARWTIQMNECHVWKGLDQMRELSLEGRMHDEDFMIHVVNNLPEEYGNF